MDVNEYFGGIDIYLFDQIQKGRFKEGMKILDVGCGNGRNMVYFMRNGYDIYGVEKSQAHINNVWFLTKQLAPDLPDTNFKVENLADISFDDEFFDAVISSAVLHFAKNTNEFMSWLMESWRVLKVGGFIFVRLASSIGIEDKIKKIEGRRFSLPDTSERFLVDEQMLMDLTYQLNGELIEPLKTTNVQNVRAMTTWCFKKLEAPSAEKGGLDSSGGLRLYRD